MAAGSLGGLAGGVTSGPLGAGIALLTLQGPYSPVGLPGPLRIAFGAIMGSVALTPIGAYVGGNLAVGDGALWASYVGGVVGPALGWMANFIVAEIPATSSLLKPALLATALIPIPGAVIGYELSHASRAGGEASAIVTPVVQPVSETSSSEQRLEVGINVRF